MKLPELIDFVANAKNVFGKLEKLDRAQSELADAMRKLGDRVTGVEATLKTLSVEIKHETYKETQDLYNDIRRETHTAYVLWRKSWRLSMLR